VPSTAIVPLSVTTAELAGQMAMPEKLLAHRVPLLCIPSFVADPTPSEVLQKFSESGNSLKRAYIRATPFLPAKEFFRQLSIAIQAELTTRIDWSDTLWANRDGQEFFVHIQNDSQPPQIQLPADTDALSAVTEATVSASAVSAVSSAAESAGRLSLVSRQSLLSGARKCIAIYIDEQDPEAAREFAEEFLVPFVQNSRARFGSLSFSLWFAEQLIFML